jgi:succinate-semialdehyde dehydrogenase / glutarate-semialdehyde dehydrogenase
MTTSAQARIPFPAEIPTGLFIDGRWREAADGSQYDVIDPATEQIYASVARATDADIDAAIASARVGFTAWRATDAWTRSGILRRTAELVRSWAEDAAAVMTSEQGKPLAEAHAEFLAAADQFDWYADEARRIYGRTVDGQRASQRTLVRREPIGVVAAFSTWNFPALLSSRKIAPALAAGCSIVVVPSEEAPLSTMLLASALAAAGLPAGIVTVLSGDSAQISERLLANPAVRKLSLTGSVPVGKLLLHAAADRILPSAMELGGHAPVLVFPDVDVAATAQQCARFKFRNSGQVCASPSRFVVHDAIHDQFLAEFAAATSKMVVGNGHDPATEVGPLSNRRRLDAAVDLVREATASGAKVVVGGGTDDRFEHGYFFTPTVLSDVPRGAAVLREEPFVPIAPVLRFDDLDEALQIANDTEFGLASYLFTNDLRTAFLASEGIEAGMVGVNTMALASAEVPFGGVKQSGFGREGGAEGVDDYTVTKFVKMELA